MMYAIYFLIIVLLVYILIQNDFAQTSSAESRKSRWIPASRLINANEYNRLEFGVRDATTCREKCTGECLATEYVKDNDGSNNNVCIFFNSFDSYLLLPRQATDNQTAIWIRN